jgi:hypothetical protein
MDKDMLGTAYLNWGTMADTSFKSSVKHFDKFLRLITDEDLKKLCNPPLGGKTYTTMKKENVSWHLMNRFAGYLLHGKWLYNPNKGLSYYSADRYFSAIKVGILHDLAHCRKQNVDLANARGMKRIRDGMVKGFVDRAIEANKALYNSHTTTSLDDMLTVATMCVWSDSLSTGCMFAYFISLFFLAGRSVEVALSAFTNISLCHPSEFPEQNEKIPLVELWRSKTQLQQDLSMFPHRDNFLQDWCFALAYSMVMNPDPDGYLFPSFAAKAHRAFRDVKGGARAVAAAAAAAAAGTGGLEAEEEDAEECGDTGGLEAEEEDAEECGHTGGLEAEEEEAEDCGDTTADLAEEEFEGSGDTTSAAVADVTGEATAGEESEENGYTTAAPVAVAVNHVAVTHVAGPGESTAAAAALPDAAEVEAQQGVEADEANAGGVVAEEEVDPTVSKKAEAKKEKAKVQAVSKYFKAVIDSLIESLGELNLVAAANEEVEAEAAGEFRDPFAPKLTINPSISSHSNKRYAINLAEDHPMIKTQDTARRAGYELKSIATVFEYMNHINPPRDRQLSRVCNNWSAVDPLGNIGGGRPPRLECVQIHAEGGKGRSVAAALFFAYDNIPMANDPEMQNLLLATILRYLPSILDLLVAHPTHKFGKSRDETWELHQFTRGLRNAGKIFDISTTTLMEWGDIVLKDFCSRNSAYVPLQVMQQVFPQEKTFVTDHRTLAGYLQSIALAGHGTHVAQNELKSQIVSLTATVNTLKVQNAQIISLLTAFLNGNGGNNGMVVAEDDDGMEEDGGMEEDRDDTEEDGRINGVGQGQDTGEFPVTIKSLTLKALFKAWHISEYYNNMAMKSIKHDHRSTVKCAIEFFTLFLEQHIPSLPEDVPSTTHPNARRWRAELTRLTDAAWISIREFYATHGRCPSDKVSVFKKFMTNLDAEHLPTGPPGEICFQPPETKYKMRTRKELFQQKQAKSSKKRARETTTTTTTDAAAAVEDPPLAPQGNSFEHTF